MGFRLVYWDQWFSTWAILSPEVHGTMYVETFVIVRTGRRAGKARCYWHLVGRGQGCYGVRGEPPKELSGPKQ